MNNLFELDAMIKPLKKRDERHYKGVSNASRHEGVGYKKVSV